MHYKNGREAKAGDPVIGKTYNRVGTQIGKIISINESSTTCNCTMAIIGDVLRPLQEEYTQCDCLFHADDAYASINGGDQSQTTGIPAKGKES